MWTFGGKACVFPLPSQDELSLLSQGTYGIREGTSLLKVPKESEIKAFLAYIVLGNLTRYQRSPFTPAEVKEVHLTLSLH